MRKLTTNRTGTVAPLLAVSLVALLGLTAMAIDLGLMTMARAQVQSAADVAALIGARELNGEKSAEYNIQRSVQRARELATRNTAMSQPIAPDKVIVRTGVYTYNPALLRFEATEASFTNANSGLSPLGAWTASRVEITQNVPVYFANVFSLLPGGSVPNNLQVRAVATAVHRPRDIAIILDFSGSMRFNSCSHFPSGGGNTTGAMNPDPIWPKFGHYSRFIGVATNGANPMQRTTDALLASQENLAPNNLTTFSVRNGPPVIGTLGETDKQYWLTKSGSSFQGAWYNNPAGGYNPNAAPCAMPAPDSFENQNSSGYLGDQYPRRTVSLTGTNWAITAQEFLTGGNSTPTGGDAHIRNHTTNGPDGGPFDPGPLAISPPSTYSLVGTVQWPTANYIPTGNRNINWYRTCGYGHTNGRANNGFSMGPKYFGKTFWIWPPDPREPNGNHPGEPNYIAGDWRKRFFYYGPSATDHSGASLATRRCDDNNVLFDSNGLRLPSANGFQVDYTAIVRWIKNTGPRVFPDNLRAGRLLYYDSIPDTIPATGGNLDQVFWRSYINYVLGIESSNRGARTLYGRDPSNWGTAKITSKNNLFNRGNYVTYTSGAPGVTSSDVNNGQVQANRSPPFMQYNDNPRRPLAHYWFGPYTMIMFLTSNAQDPNFNLWPGTCSEAQCWQLKAAVQSSLDDIRRNHPNDWASLIYYSNVSQYNEPRVPMGQDYTRMKNALWYPRTLLDQLGNPNAEFRPYNSSFGKSNVDGNIPNANGGTCPEMGLKLAYNEFSSASANGRNYNGRRGAAKMAIHQTDGVPNHWCGGTLSNNGPYLSAYTTTANIGVTTNVGNGGALALERALEVINQICTLTSNRGFSTPRIPARVHSVAFGDLFEPTSIAGIKPIALKFLVDGEIAGRTSPPGATQLPDYKIVVGPYQTRIDKLRTAFEYIMQSGIQVSLVGSYGDDL